MAGSVTGSPGATTAAALIKSLQHANSETVLKNMSTDDIVTVLKYANEAYRNSSHTVMTDALYDHISDVLEDRDPDHPFLQEVGATVKGAKTDLPYWMGSLNKIRDSEAGIAKWKAMYPGDVVLSDKLDGNSGMLVLGAKTRALYSRGNGYQGMNLSHMIPYLNLPTNKKLGKASAETPWVVRGELIISRANWEQMKDSGANARNVVAGILNRATPDPATASRVDFVAYELISPKMSPSAGLALLKEKGFNVVHNERVVHADLTMQRLSDMLHKRRQGPTASPYEIDGIVVYQDDAAAHDVVKGKNPTNAFAFKSIHTHYEVEVTVTEVEWNVSKDGYMKPTVKFAPVSLNGVSISRATGFNAAFIETHKIGPGAQIVIIRSGDVIPHINRVLTPAAMAALPSGVAYHWNASHVDILTDATDDPQLIKSTLEHFAKKLDIKGVGPGVISKMVDAGINTIQEFMNTTAADLLRIGGFQAKSAGNVADAIAAARATATCADIMVASNIFGRGLGNTKIQAVLKAFPDILRLHQRHTPPRASQIAAIDGIGAATAALFLENLPKFFVLADSLGLSCDTSSPGAHPHAPAPQPTHGQQAAPAGAQPLNVEGMTIVFTGFRNKEWEKQLVARGAKVGSSVSKKTSLMVAKDPEEDSTKLTTAKELGIPIVSMMAFQRQYL